MNAPKLDLSFDVGHSSIGWAVFQASDTAAGLTDTAASPPLPRRPSSAKPDSAAAADAIPAEGAPVDASPDADLDAIPDTLAPELLGCGVVTFGADDCLASGRRVFRRQRRHIRSTRTRIRRLKAWLERLGVLTRAALDKPGGAWPWLLAARVLAAGKSGTGKKAALLTWPELWDVLRWYAHNRGYDGNRRWSGSGEAEDDGGDDAEKEKNAKELMAKHGASTMAETVCKVLEIDPHGPAGTPTKRFKGLNAAFPRGTVEAEVRRILEAHIGHLKGCDERLIHVLMARELAAVDRAELREQADIRLPLRYEGGLLFGQLVPRFDNRILSICPVSGEKVPTRNAPEFLRFRWAMQLANITVAREGEALHPLSAEERRAVDAVMRERGHLTPTELKKAVKEITRCQRNNLDTMFLDDEEKRALSLDPVQELITAASQPLSVVWPALPDSAQKRVRGQLRRGKRLTLAEIRAKLAENDGEREAVAAFDAALREHVAAKSPKKAKPGAKPDAKSGSKKPTGPVTIEELLQKPLKVDTLSGRAAYSRAVMQKAYDEVMEGKHPKEEGGCLFVTEQMREAQLNRKIAEQTNNHLVRHRLLILERLHEDIIKEYAKGDASRVENVTIEVNRDLKEMSGKTAKEKAQDLGQRLANFKSVVDKLEKDESFMNTLRQMQNGSSKIPPGIIRKARIAEDLGWTCPYTGAIYEKVHLLTKFVDKDHIVPQSERASDSLDSLVITFSEVNKWKGKRTAVQFVQEEQGKPVPGRPTLSMMTINRYRELVGKLETFKGHEDDKRRKRKRKQLMLIEHYNEQEFTPGDLTKTSQLVRLGAQALKRKYQSVNKQNQPHIISLPGSVTGTVRKGWKLLGCLAAATPQVKDPQNNLKTKTEIRGITHLHHALDACVLGLASKLIPNNGRVWELIVKRKLNKEEATELRTKTRNLFQMDTEGGFHLRPLPKKIEQQLRQRLAEKRVVQHVPKRINGLKVEQNTWRVLKEEDGEVTLKQRVRQPDGSRLCKQTTEKAGKLMGLQAGKLNTLKGALVIPDNFGVALDPTPTIIPYHKVWPRIQELKTANGEKVPRVLKRGMLIRIPQGRYTGIWRIVSVKNDAKMGIVLDLSDVDAIKWRTETNDTYGNKVVFTQGYGNVRLKTLLQNGLIPCKTPLTGVPSCPTT